MKAPKAPADQDWCVDDPDVTAPPAPSTVDRDIVAGKRRPPQRPTRRRPMEKLLAAMFLGAALTALVHASALVSPLLLGLFIAMFYGLFTWIGRGRRTARTREFQRGVESARARIETWTHWQATHRISRDAFPLTGPARDVRSLADGIATAAASLRDTRAWREGWVGDEWNAVLDRQVWSLMDRLRASVSVRIALAAATERPTLAEAIAHATQEMTDLDAEARALQLHLEDAGALAREIDRGLAARDAAEAQARRDADLLAQLTGSVPSTTAESDYELRLLRDQVLNTAAETDLRILFAQLAELADSLRSPKTTTPTTGELA